MTIASPESTRWLLPTRRSLWSCAALLLALSACSSTDSDPVTGTGTDDNGIVDPQGNTGDPNDDGVVPFTLSALEVNLDPYGNAPLSAEILVTADVPVKASVSIAGSTPVAYGFDDYATSLRVPVIGLYAGTDNAVTVAFEDAAGNRTTRETTISTAALPDFFPDITIDERNDLSADGLVFTDFAWGQGTRFHSKPMAFDQEGAVRWWLDMASLGRWAAPIQFTARDTLIIGAYDSVREYAMTGELLREVFFPGYVQHHDVIELPNGHLLVAVDNTDIETIEDFIIEVTWDGEIIAEWDLRPILDRWRTNVIAHPIDWFHMNSLWYDERDDSLIVSGRNQGVVKLTRDNQVVWILAPHEGFGPAGEDASGPDTSTYLLTAVDADGIPYDIDVQDGFVLSKEFDWPWGQHAAMIQEDGNLFLYDNGFNRRFGLPHNDYSRAVEYRIDEATKTVQEVWQYGLERDREMFSPIISDVDILANGNRLMTSGISFGEVPQRARIAEVTYPEKIVAFEATLNFRNTMSEGTFAWGDFDLVYRAEKWVLYSGTGAGR